MKTRFISLEELQKACPIGLILKTWSEHREEFYFCKNDLKEYRKRWDEVIILSDEKVFLKRNYCLKVEGYLFDGEFWYPAFQGWDGWIEFEEEDCECLQK